MVLKKLVSMITEKWLFHEKIEYHAVFLLEKSANSMAWLPKMECMRLLFSHFSPYTTSNREPDSDVRNLRYLHVLMVKYFYRHIIFDNFFQCYSVKRC